jgi:hypothetical protein
LLTDVEGALERTWWTDIDRNLLEVAVTVPHLVAIMPREIAGDLDDDEAAIRRMAGSIVVSVEHVSSGVRAFWNERR